MIQKESPKGTLIGKFQKCLDHIASKQFVGHTSFVIELQGLTGRALILQAECIPWQKLR